jgi:hypothetical protein
MACIVVNVAVLKESHGSSAVTLHQNADSIKRDGALFYRHTRIPPGHDACSAVRKDTVSYGGSRNSGRGIYPEAGSNAVLDRRVDQGHVGAVSRRDFNTNRLTANRTILDGDGFGRKDTDTVLPQMNTGKRGSEMAA